MLLEQIDISKLTKLYYSIGEVADLFEVNTSLIRFWEKEFKLLKPKKNKKGNRLFTIKDIEKIKKIYQLVKVEGYTLDGAKKAIKQKKEPSQPSINEIIVQRLEKVRKRLLEMRNMD